MQFCDWHSKIKFEPYPGPSPGVDAKTQSLGEKELAEDTEGWEEEEKERQRKIVSDA